MKAEEYDSWYRTARGRWAGQREIELILEDLRPGPGESLLDVGCGTGFFTRELANRVTGPVIGIDIDPERVAYARLTGASRVSYAVADARALPFPTASFDLVISIAVLCFIEDDPIAAVREIVRVTRRRFLLGLLNRNSLLWLQRAGGKHGDYVGAHWHTAREAKLLLGGLPVQKFRLHTAVQVPSGGRYARAVERRWPARLPTGSLILVGGDVADGALVAREHDQCGS